MATINLVGNGLFGSTGSGSFVGSTSATLVTPILGVAAATSINFGGSTLGTYAEFTSSAPVVTFATNGDLSVAYGTQAGRYSRVGNIVTYIFYLAFTPTYTTASGNLQISIPFASNGPSVVALGNATTQAPAFPVGTTSLALEILPSTTQMLVAASGTATNAAAFTTTEITSGVGRAIAGTITYLA